MRGLRGFFLLISFAALPAQARVFNLNKENFASYLAVSYGPSQIGINALEGESAATEFSSSVAANQGGEFGFVYATSRVSWRFGFELLKPAALTGIEAGDGTNPSYTVSSVVMAYLPKVGIELNLRTMDQWRVYIFGHFGTGTLSVTNTYTDVAIAPGADFVVKYQGAATTQGGGMGYEFTAFDTTSVLIEAGYRQMTFDKVVYAEDVTDFQGAHAAGDQAMWTDGKRREIDFTGGYVTIGARWYLF